MVNQQLLDYIKQQLKQDVSRERIKSALTGNGWLVSDVEEGFAAIALQSPQMPHIPPPSSSSQPTSNFTNPAISPNLQPTSPVSPVPGVQPRPVFTNPIMYPNPQPTSGFANPHISPQFSNPNPQPAPSFINPVIYSKPQPIPSSINPVINQSAILNNQKKPKHWGKILFWIFVIILLGAGLFLFNKYVDVSFKLKNKVEAPVVNQETAQTSQTPIPLPAPIPVTTNPDIDRVKAILDDVKQGYLTGNKTLIIQHASVATAKLLSSSNSKQELVSSFTVNSVSQSGSNIVVNATSVSAGNPDTQDMVFIKEGGDWKFDVNATIQQAETNPVPVTNELTDLAMVDITTTPNSPKAGDGNTNVQLRFKNLGPGAVNNCVNYEWKWTVGDKHETGGGGTCGVIVVGNTVSVHISPTPFFLKGNTSPGPMTVHAEINYDNKINETNKTNNAIDQTINFVR